MLQVYFVSAAILTRFIIIRLLPGCLDGDWYPGIRLREDRNQSAVRIHGAGYLAAGELREYPNRGTFPGECPFKPGGLFFRHAVCYPFGTRSTANDIAVNVAGAAIPTLVSLYLLVKGGMYDRGLMAVAIVTIVVYWMAQPVRSWYRVPTLIPPLVAAVAALMLFRQSAPFLAYIVGSLRTLIGADLLNLGKIPG